jgi:glycosidase
LVEHVRADAETLPDVWLVRFPWRITISNTRRSEMPTTITNPDLLQAIQAMQVAAHRRQTKRVIVDGQPTDIPYPFPSPGDWRDCWIYFLMLDRFANPFADPRGPAWNRIFTHRHGGTFKGVQAQLGYVADLGAKAIWLSPVLKNSKPDFEYNYHGYETQDFLNVDERFASDGTRATAERELAELVDEAHARGLYVIFDIVLNHAGRIFDYERGGRVVSMFSDTRVMDAALGSEPSIEWLNGLGFPRSDWRDDLPSSTALSADDAVWPADLQNRFFFRRRGNKLTDHPNAGGFVRGDFGDMRQLVAEYDAAAAGQEALRAQYGVAPVLTILIRVYQYLIATYDIDGYRIDTVKYVFPDAVRNFGNAMREFGLSVGKRNFFTFGEVYDDEETIAGFVGRRTAGGEGFGIDAALDFPLFYKLPAVAKGFEPVESIREVFQERKDQEKGQLSSHGEAGRYFVSFLDNHDQHERIQHPDTPHEQVSLALALLFSLQGIPCVYYGTEQGLAGAVHDDGTPDLTANESTREALWGKKPVAFDRKHAAYQLIRALSSLRTSESALAYGRLYFREVSGNGTDFGHSSGKGGIVAFSRILVDREVLVVANTSSTNDFSGSVVVDRDLNPKPRPMKVAFSSRGTTGSGTVQQLGAARFFGPCGVSSGPTAALPVVLKKSEVQILTQA